MREVWNSILRNLDFSVEEMKCPRKILSWGVRKLDYCSTELTRAAVWRRTRRTQRLETGGPVRWLWIDPLVFSMTLRIFLVPEACKL